MGQSRSVSRGLRLPASQRGQLHALAVLALPEPNPRVGDGDLGQLAIGRDARIGQQATRPAVEAERRGVLARCSLRTPAFRHSRARMQGSAGAKARAWRTPRRHARGHRSARRCPRATPPPAPSLRPIEVREVGGVPEGLARRTWRPRRWRTADRRGARPPPGTSRPGHAPRPGGSAWPGGRPVPRCRHASRAARRCGCGAHGVDETTRPRRSSGGTDRARSGRLPVRPDGPTRSTVPSGTPRRPRPRTPPPAIRDRCPCRRPMPLATRTRSAGENASSRAVTSASTVSGMSSSAPLSLAAMSSTTNSAFPWARSSRFAITHRVHRLAGRGREGQVRGIRGMKWLQIDPRGLRPGRIGAVARRADQPRPVLRLPAMVPSMSNEASSAHCVSSSTTSWGAVTTAARNAATASWARARRNDGHDLVALTCRRDVGGEGTGDQGSQGGSSGATFETSSVSIPTHSS